MALTSNRAVLDWIDEMAAMTQPDRIVWIDGSEAQLEDRVKELLEGEMEQILRQIEKRDRYIFYAHVLDERTFTELAAELGLTYKGVTAAYYRVIHKIRDALRGDEYEF